MSVAAAVANSQQPSRLTTDIRPARDVLEGERKLVTVLFVDVVGSTELSERIDPEQWLRIIERVFTILCDGVRRFDGTVDKFTGDGIMALFGAPTAHEDHAQRACYAALQLQDDLGSYAAELSRSDGLDLAVRIGIHSGEVVVAAIGAGPIVEYTAFGHAVGVARRTESLAASGRVCVTEATARLVEGYLALRDLGEFEVKGASRPLRIYELTGIGQARGRLDIARGRGFSRFVGRGNQMQELEGALEGGLSREARVIGIMGEAGVGKSRLCHELARHARVRGVSVHHVAGQPRTQSLALLPVLELLRSYFEIAATDSAQTARERIAAELPALDERFAEGLPLMFDLLGVQDPGRTSPRLDPDVRQARVLDLASRAIRALNVHEPAVTLIEDLQWLDHSSESFLATYLDAVQDGRGLLLVTFRPEYKPAWLARPDYTQIELPPLGREAADALLAELLGDDPSLEELSRAVRGRTGGNPFFMEEVVQSLADAGNLEGERGAYRLARHGGAAAVPANVQAALSARIDRLERREKSVLQAAAIIGKDFPESVLARMLELETSELEASLRSLVAGQFILERELYPQAMYEFKHPLTQEVAYGSQLSDRRAGLHAACARALAEQHEARQDERAALIAQHWEAAGDKLAAAQWHARAAAWSGNSTPYDSIHHWQRVRDLTDALPESEQTLELGLAARSYALQYGWRLGISPEDAETVFREAERMAVRGGDVHTRTVLLAMYGLIRGSNHGNLQDYVALARQALALAEASGDPELQMAIAAGASWALFNVGDLREAVLVVDRALEQADTNLSPGTGTLVASPYAQTLIFKGGYLLHLGELERGRDLVAHGIDIALERGDIEVAGRGHVWFSFLCFFTGESDVALARAREGLEISERIGDSFSLAMAWFGLALAEQMRGSWQPAIDAVERSMAIARQAGTSAEMDPWRLWVLAESHLGLGNPGQAHDLAQDGVSLAGSRRQHLPEAFLNLTSARALLGSARPGSRTEIEQALARALGLAGQCGAKSLAPFVYVARAELARCTGDAEQQHTALLEAHRLFTEIGAVRHAQRLASESLTTEPVSRA